MRKEIKKAMRNATHGFLLFASIIYGLTKVLPGARPFVVEKRKKIGNVMIYQYKSIDTGMSLFDDLMDFSGEKARKIACRKYSLGEAEKKTVIDQRLKFESYGHKMIVGKDTIYTKSYNESYDFTSFDMFYSFNGYPTIDQILVNLKYGSFEYNANFHINLEEKDWEWKDAKKDSMVIEQLKETLERALNNPSIVERDTNKIYYSGQYGLNRGIPLKDICN